MKVSELIALLAAENPDEEIFLAIEYEDNEGDDVHTDAPAAKLLRSSRIMPPGFARVQVRPDTALMVDCPNALYLHGSRLRPLP